MEISQATSKSNGDEISADAGENGQKKGEDYGRIPRNHSTETINGRMKAKRMVFLFVYGSVVFKIPH